MQPKHLKKQLLKDLTGQNKIREIHNTAENMIKLYPISVFLLFVLQNKEPDRLIEFLNLPTKK